MGGYQLHKNGQLQGTDLAYNFILSRLIHAPDKDLKLERQIVILLAFPRLQS